MYTYIVESFICYYYYLYNSIYRCINISFGTITSCLIIDIHTLDMNNKITSKREKAMHQFMVTEQKLVEFLSIDLLCTLEGRYIELRKAWDKIEEEHDHYVENLLEEDPRTAIEEEEKWMDAPTHHLNQIEGGAEAAGCSDECES